MSSRVLLLPLDSYPDESNSPKSSPGEAPVDPTDQLCFPFIMQRIAGPMQ
jgi:hypothetical protein